MSVRPRVTRLALLLVGLGWLALAHPQAQSAPVIQWTHPGTNVTHFQIVIGTTGTWVVDAGLPTPSGTTYEYALPALPAGTWQIKVRACYGSDCQDSAAMTVVKMVPAGATALNYYWVDPGGTKTTWSECKSDTPLHGADACTLATANAAADAGQTVWLRGGTYSYDVNDGEALKPNKTGSVGSKIVFAAHPDETPTIQQANTTNQAYGLVISGKDYIVVRGVTFHNFQRMSARLVGDADYNEIAYCAFTHDAAYEAQTDRVIIVGYNLPVDGDAEPYPWANHNWLHHNYVSRGRYGPCGEGQDLLRLGMAQNPYGIYASYSVDDYNTVEQNYFEYAAHADIVTYSKHNVVRNNIGHNEPWITGCTAYDGSMVDIYGLKSGSISETSATISTGSKTFTVDADVSTSSFVAGAPVSVVYGSDWSQAMYGVITSYSGTSLVVNVTRVTTAGSGETHSGWIVSHRNFPKYSTVTQDAKYGHRVAIFGDSDTENPNLNLIEGNRFGFAGVNPNNGGADNLDLESPGNIARYNAVYGAMASGIMFKGANSTTQTGGVNNRVYNNTAYGNGQGWDISIYGGLNLGYNGQGISQYSIGGGATYNQIKNNLVYGNGQGDICQLQWGDPACTPAAYDTLSKNLTGTDPLFVNPVLTDPTSQNLIPTAHGYVATPIPNLRIGASSPAIDYGDALTTVHADDTGSGTTLVVTDASYFQDASWGSSLANGITSYPDWIAVGTVSNVVQISSISGNTITLASGISRNDGDSVWLYKKSDGVRVLYGAAPDAGAHEYGIGAAVAPTGVVVR